MADRAMRIPGVQRDNLCVSMKLHDAHQAYMAFRTVIVMASG